MFKYPIHFTFQQHCKSYRKIAFFVLSLEVNFVTLKNSIDVDQSSPTLNFSMQRKMKLAFCIRMHMNGSEWSG